MRGAAIIGLKAPLGLAACAEPTGAVLTPAGVLPAATVAADAQPLGSATFSLDQAVFGFQDIHDETQPRFKGAESVLRRNEHSRSPVPGTWFNPQAESSVSLRPRDGRPVRSFIFASDQEPAVLGMALATGADVGGGEDPAAGMDPSSGAAPTATASGAVMRFEPRVDSRRNLHRAVLVAPR